MFEHKPKAPQQTKCVKPAKPNRELPRQNRDVDSMLYLQRTIGNQAVLRLLQTATENVEASSASNASTRFAYDFSRIQVQATALSNRQQTLKISAAGDKYEQGADRIVDEALHQKMPEGEKKAGIQAKASPQAQKSEHEAIEDLDNLLHRSTDERIPRSPCPFSGTFPLRTHANTEHPINQRIDTYKKMRPRIERVPNLSSNLVLQIRSLKGNGFPLSISDQIAFEEIFGCDFRAVRVHTDGQSNAIAEQLGARAFTLGQEIVFGRGQYEPDTTEGKSLLVHELTHVIQQSQSIYAAPHRVAHQSEPSEKEANSVARNWSKGSSVSVKPRPDCSGVIARVPLEILRHNWEEVALISLSPQAYQLRSSTEGQVPQPPGYDPSPCTGPGNNSA